MLAHSTHVTDKNVSMWGMDGVREAVVYRNAILEYTYIRMVEVSILLNLIQHDFIFLVTLQTSDLGTEALPVFI